jgi:serine/threonine protein kinase/Tol biopolymer transport system component
MGEVYVARDMRLDRTVAIKVLPSEIANDPERRTRLEREAKAIAALNHPNICTLHDVGESNGLQFLVMERLEGQTLADRLAKGPLKLEDTLVFGIQIADALDRAHSRGIVHRDLKPANVMLTASGAKLLDFGLAKLRPQAGPFVDALTRSAPLTGEGTIVGTLQYMAPEQLEGDETDARADIFALGGILYEMASGRRAFEGNSQASLIASILAADPPPLTKVSALVPAALDRIVKVCLAKEPANRWSSAHDVALQLRAISAETPSNLIEPSRTRSNRREGVAWAIALAALAGVVALVLTRPGATPESARSVVSILASGNTVLTPGEAPVIAPDGRRVAFVASDNRSGRSLLYVRELDRPDATALTGTDGVSQPFWAPDSRRLGFFAEGSLKTVAIAGGAPQTLALAPVPRGGAWNQDDVIIFVPDPPTPMHRVSASGGEVTKLPTAPGNTPNYRFFPSFLPDGRHFVHLAVGLDRSGFSISVASIDSADTRELVRSRAGATYAAGHLFFRRETTLVGQPFDANRLALSGTPVVVGEDVGFNGITYQGLFSVSASGTVAYAGSAAAAQLTWIDRSGRRVGTVGAPGDYNSLCLTPDGRRLVYDLADPATAAVDVWMMELETGASSRLTYDQSVDFYPVCSPTGTEIVLASLRQGPPDLYRQLLDAPGGEKLLLDTPIAKIPSDWSHDGRYILYQAATPTSQRDLWSLELATGNARQIVSTRGDDRSGRLSPDDRWLAYASNETNRFEVFVQPFPPTGAKWQITRDGGHQPQWSRDGRELYYVGPDQRLMAVSVTTTGGTFTPGRHELVAETRFIGWERVAQGSQYAFTPNGQRVLVIDAASAVRPISLVLNWVKGPG